MASQEMEAAIRPESESDVQESSDLARLRSDFAAMEERIERNKAASSVESLSLELPGLILGLNDIDRDVLELCLGYALDARHAKRFAYLNNDITKPYITPHVIETVFQYDFEKSMELRSRLSPAAPLRHHRLVILRNEIGHSFISAGVFLEERMPEYCVGNPTLDPATTDYLSFAPPESIEELPVVPERKAELQNIARHINPSIENKALFVFHGAPGSGRLRSVAAVCTEAGLPLLHCNVPRLLAQGNRTDIREAIRIAVREALLFQSGLVFTDVQVLAGTDGEAGREELLTFLMQITGDFHGLYFFTCDERPRTLPPAHVALIELRFSVPEYGLRSELWAKALEQYPQAVGSMSHDDLAARYVLTGGQIERAVQDAATFRMLAGETITADEALLHACQSSNSRNLAELATRVEPKFGWDDIVLPEEHDQQLREVCAHMTYREQVYDNWGYDQKLASGRGLNVLFSGPPGTGKTMAAGIIARELGLVLYKIDLSTVVSKYVGETEKNLSRIFTEAAQSQAVLFFDEADALFGKRSEVKDAHDRYANIETGYLLQKMEEYEGVTILATNLSENMDDAFTRRLHFIVDFPMPDRGDRERIWRLAFPQDAPMADDPDFSFLAERLKLSGANIKNIALHAAFYAAADKGSICMQHIARAARREYEKEGRPMPRADLEAFRELAGGL